MDSSPDSSPFLLDLDLGSRDLDLKALDLDLDSEVLPASPFFKSFVLYLYLKNVPISYLCNRLELEYKLEVCALCGDADPRRVCRELHFV